MYDHNVGPGKPVSRSRRGLRATLARIFGRYEWATTLLRIRDSRGMAALGPMDDAEEGLMALNDAGLPEADLTEEQRAEAVRRVKQKPRIG